MSLSLVLINYNYTAKPGYPYPWIYDKNVYPDCFLNIAGVCEVYFLQHKLRQFLNPRNMRQLWLIAGFALLNANIALHLRLIQLISSNGTRE